MSVTDDVGLKSKKRRRSGKKSQKISFDEEIVPKSIAEKFNVKPEKGHSEKFDSGKKGINKIKHEGTSESPHPKRRNRKNKPSSSDDVIEANMSMDVEEENKTQKCEEIVKSTDLETPESPHPKKQKRKKKLSQSQEESMDVQQEALEEEPHDDTELDPSNPVVKKGESKRALQRQKHQKLLLDKKIKVDLVLQEKSLNYLSRWKHNQSEWKFEKLRQVWLQQNMFDCDRIPERFWTTLVEYFSGAKGKIRKTILDEALTIIKQTEQEEVKEAEDAANEDEDKSNKVQRAREIIQTLQE